MWNGKVSSFYTSSKQSHLSLLSHMSIKIFNKANLFVLRMYYVKSYLNDFLASIFYFLFLSLYMKKYVAEQHYVLLCNILNQMLIFSFIY